MIDLEEVHAFCSSLEFVTEDFPFDSSTLVFRVGGKIFALMNVDRFTSINLKCNPEKAIELREIYQFIEPGYHMNKKHWNTIHLDMDLRFSFLKELIEHSYQLVYNSLTKKQKTAFWGNKV